MTALKERPGGGRINDPDANDDGSSTGRSQADRGDSHAFKWHLMIEHYIFRQHPALSGGNEKK